MSRPTEKSITLSNHRLELRLQDGRTLVTVYATYALAFLLLFAGVPVDWCLGVVPITVGGLVIIRSYRARRERREEHS